MKKFKFIFERGTMEAEAADVVLALALILKTWEENSSKLPKALTTPLGGLVKVEYL